MNINRYTRGNICVLIDAANLESALSGLGWHADYTKIHSLFSSNTIIHLRFCSVRHATQNHINFLAFLRHKGYTLVTKPLKIISIGTGASERIRKANFDVEISVDALHLIREYETCVLFSGDSDFDYLIKHLRVRNKKVIVISSKKHVARELIESCDKYVDLTDLRSFIERTHKQSPSLGTSPSTGG